MTEVPTEELEYPAETWKGFFKNHFGPSMLWALVSIGASHMVLAPTVGGYYGLFAIWIFVFVYVVKYGGWELGIRYNYGIGKNPIEAYTDLPGPKNWALWLSVIIFVFFYTGIIASVAAGATALSMVVSPFSFIQTYLLLMGIAGVFVLLARYTILEKVLLVFTVALGVLLVLGAAAGPPSTEVAAETAFELPELTGALFVGLFAAVAGFAPTGHSTSIIIGSWSMAKGDGARALRKKGADPTDEKYHEYIKEWIRTGRRDFNIGYAFSLILAIAMILLATNVLFPEPPTDDNFEIALGEILSESFGAWAFWAVIVGGFAALYSTVITTLDGGSRAAADILPIALENDDLDTERLRRVIVAVMTLGCIIPILVIGGLPVTLIVWIAALIAMVEVFFYPANWYIVEKNLPEAFRPSTKWKVYYVITIVLVFVFGIMGALETFDVIGA